MEVRLLQRATTLHFAVGFLLYQAEINSRVDLSLAVCLLGVEIKDCQRTAQTAVVFFSLGSETTLGQRKEPKVLEGVFLCHGHPR